MSRCLGAKSVGACLDVLPAPAPAPRAREFRQGFGPYAAGERGMSKSGQKVESRPPEMASRVAEGSDAIDHLRNDPEIRRALALVLMRQAMKALEEAEEDRACCHCLLYTSPSPRD